MPSKLKLDPIRNLNELLSVLHVSKSILHLIVLPVEHWHHNRSNSILLFLFVFFGSYISFILVPDGRSSYGHVHL